jgi:hypothetical protein
MGKRQLAMYNMQMLLKLVSFYFTQTPNCQLLVANCFLPIANWFSVSTVYLPHAVNARYILLKQKDNRLTGSGIL